MSIVKGIFFNIYPAIFERHRNRAIFGNMLGQWPAPGCPRMGTHCIMTCRACQALPCVAIVVFHDAFACADCIVVPCRRYNIPKGTYACQRIDCNSALSPPICPVGRFVVNIFAGISIGHRSVSQSCRALSMMASAYTLALVRCPHEQTTI